MLRQLVMTGRKPMMTGRLLVTDWKTTGDDWKTPSGHGVDLSSRYLDDSGVHLPAVCRDSLVQVHLPHPAYPLHSSSPASPCLPHTHHILYTVLLPLLLSLTQPLLHPGPGSWPAGGGTPCQTTSGLKSTTLLKIAFMIYLAIKRDYDQLCIVVELAGGG